MTYTYIHGDEREILNLVGGGGGVGQLIYQFVVSASSLAMMFRHIIATFLLFSVTLIAAVNQPPPPHSFVSRTHQGSKTVVKDGECSKESISKVFWTLQEGGYTYAKSACLEIEKMVTTGYVCMLCM